MFAPMISAPIPGPCLAAIAWSRPSVPPDWPRICAAESCGHHPLVEPVPGVTERSLENLVLAGGEPVERDREVVDTDTGHGGSFEVVAGRSIAMIAADRSGALRCTQVEVRAG